MSSYVRVVYNIIYLRIHVVVRLVNFFLYCVFVKRQGLWTFCSGLMMIKKKALVFCDGDIIYAREPSFLSRVFEHNSWDSL